MVEESDIGRFLRTVVRKDVHDRLTAFAQSYSTGMGKWDYSVAIQVLLDFYDNQTSTDNVNQKLDYIVAKLLEKEQFEKTDEVKKDEKKKGTEMLNGEILE